MPVEFLSEEQVARFGRFVADPSPLELERCFRLNAEALGLLKGKRREENRLGMAVQWGTVRLLGTFLGDDPTAVPPGVPAFVAEQLGIPDPSCLQSYAERPKTAYEHQWEIRRKCGYRDFAAGEAELRAYLAARVWATEDGPRALFDRAVLWLIEHLVLLPGITVLTRLVAEARAAEHERIHAMLADAPTPEQLRGLEQMLVVPKDARTSTFDRLRGGKVNISGRGFESALERAFEIKELGTGEVELPNVPPAKVTALARYGLSVKAPGLRELSPKRRAATLLATIRQLEVDSVDDALDLFDLLMATKLLAKAERLSDKDKLAKLPALRREAAKIARALGVLFEMAEGSAAEQVSLAEAWDRIERAIPWRGSISVQSMRRGRCLRRSGACRGLSAAGGSRRTSWTPRSRPAPGGGLCSRTRSCRRGWLTIVRTCSVYWRGFTGRCAVVRCTSAAGTAGAVRAPACWTGSAGSRPGRGC